MYIVLFLKVFKAACYVSHIHFLVETLMSLEEDYYVRKE
jgi:hypothetical protein